MKTLKTLAVLALALGLGACGSTPPVSRNLPLDATGVSIGSKSAAVAAQYAVAEIRVAVPQQLRVSEANMFYPIADIVWRGEPLGNRYAQVKAIFEDGLGQGTAAMHAGRKVIVEVEVTRFHSLTEKTRYTIGGVHSVKFNLTIRDAETGMVLDGPRPVVADVKGAGGSAAIAEEMAGRTQRIVITEHLAEVIRRELAPIAAPDLSTGPTSRLEGDLILTPVPVAG